MSYTHQNELCMCLIAADLHTIHYTTLHCTTLHCIALHYTIHYICTYIHTLHTSTYVYIYICVHTYIPVLCKHNTYDITLYLRIYTYRTLPGVYLHQYIYLYISMSTIMWSMCTCINKTYT